MQRTVHTHTMAAPSEDSPGVRFPPPFLFVLGFGAGLLLRRLIALPLLPRSTFLLVLAWALVFAGLGLGLWAAGTFFRARTALIPHRPATEFVVRGPYRFSRNPMYVSLTLLYVGLALWVGTVWPLVLLPLVLVGLWRLVIQREEAYLERAFGADYLAYRQRVRRWL